LIHGDDWLAVNEHLCGFVGDLQRVDLKVNVSCCDGCRRKVMKAMSLKGVLRTEIHPSLDRVTVVGNVDTKVLVKKLAKVGKIAEVLVAAASGAEEKQKRREGDGGKDRAGDGGDSRMAPAGEKSKRKEEAKDKTGEKAAAASDKNKDCHKCAAHQQSERGDDAADHGKAPSSKTAARNDESAFEQEGDRFSGAKPSSPYDGAATHQHYYRAEPPTMAVPMHMPYYAPANMTAPSYYAPVNAPVQPYYAPANVAAPSYYGGGGYYAMPPPVPPMPMPMPQQQQQMLIRPQPSRFDVDYFNEDNTVGCRVM
jgi:hypothetical protein